MSPLARARPDLAAFVPYASARRSGLVGAIRLNANESPWADDGDTAALNRYPDPQPLALRSDLAALYGVAEDRLWTGRGSDEAIDLLLRGFCRAGRDNVVGLAPSFGMYRIGAQLQGAEYRALTLNPDDGFALDPQRLLALVDADTKLVVLCSPNNPTGELHHDVIGFLADALADRALLVVDEAYIEFAGIPSATALLDRHDNLVVLRTLSKAHALAGARVGSLIAHPDVARFIGRIAAPYPLPLPCVAAAIAALEPGALERTRARIATLVGERRQLADALAARPDVRTVWPSAANFVLARFADGAAALQRALAAGVVLRDVSAQPGLADCLRITVGSPYENETLLEALA
ncbi:MAG TPA: histidinol-phosphate transaminase [Dokdonella sp.]|uniref:histidinol-phosphate transaminase n=1 Tax=Dokdonella sp. TaxID=2291710 RepID=UPI002BEA2397|nr:histidinol-phosphate transaminase [Dokdonella sp.]HUD41317.1 histidinol-phosphate transaminase [Dokdonella sp.]